MKSTNSIKKKRAQQLKNSSANLKNGCNGKNKRIHECLKSKKSGRLIGSGIRREIVEQFFILCYNY